MGNVLQTGRAQGMYMLKDNIRELHGRGLIDDAALQGFAKENYS